MILKRKSLRVYFFSQLEGYAINYQFGMKCNEKIAINSSTDFLILLKYRRLRWTGCIAGYIKNENKIL